MHGAPGRHVDDLHAPAHGQQWLLVFHRPAGQSELGRVAIRIGAAAQCRRLLVIGGGVEIYAAGKKHAVEPIVDGAERGGVAGQQGNDPGHGPSLHQNAHVLLAHHPAARQLPRDLLEGLGRNSDDRSLRHAWSRLRSLQRSGVNAGARGRVPSNLSRLPRSRRSTGPPPPSGRRSARNVASCRSALVPSSRIRKAYSTSFRLPSSSITSPRNHSISSRISVARRQLLLLAEVDQLAVEAVAHRPPLVLLDQRRRVDAERHVVAPQLPQLGDDRLEDGRDAHRLVDPRADVADAELQRRVTASSAARPTRSSMPSGMQPVVTSVSTSVVVVAPTTRARGGMPERGKLRKMIAAVRLQPGVAAHPERRAASTGRARAGAK